ncbi:GNAT family N-acetyltransferase [Arthrobacter roseus]|uniref:GNAT family N-acetyltransferase n=1 Tax=Arthrobacter roseus TaxID=136274 RepID=UPI001965DC4A|nr:GNAT family N-acetyltransferase [Arthrobacter roseus]MBM7849474.1 RimJ/RimL family protein N-acetyltransferase [Arthrobacter roseus]
MAMSTNRLVRDRPVASDADGVYAICCDARVWGHFPSLRHTNIEQSHAQLERWVAAWERDGLGTWIVRKPGNVRIIGYSGASVTRDTFWNIGYRFAPDLHGRGYATEVSLEAMRQVKGLRPHLPVVAYLLEHNVASARVAEKIGLTLIHRGPDVGNPDPSAVRLVYADRPLTAAELTETIR